MIKTSAMMLEELKNYASPKTKLARMVKNGECYQIIKGLYETDKNVSPYLLAGSIYGPSYISFDFALSRYGLIPEKVCVVTCASFEKKKKKFYDTPFGKFSYQDVPSKAFPYGIELCNENEYWYRIASPEKALCDKLYTISPVKNISELADLLFLDLRIDKYELKNLDYDKIEELSNYYRTTNINILCSLLRRKKI